MHDIPPSPSFIESLSNDLKLFLKEHSLHNNHLIPLPMDASKRYYYRLKDAKKLVMVSPSSEKPEQFLRIAQLLQENGLRSPSFFASRGDYYLIEDFGHTTYRKALSDDNRKELYTLATNVLIHLKETITEKPDFIPEYSINIFLDEASVFLEWFLNMDRNSHDGREYRSLWRDMLASIHVPHCLILRDYHIDNLFFLNNSKDSLYKNIPDFHMQNCNTTQVQTCGLIDFQDAIWGPVTYDLVSLTEDARIDVPDDLRDFLMDLYLASFPSSLHKNLRHAAKILDMHRQLRILGVFARLQKRDNKQNYAQYKPRLLAYVYRNLKDPFFFSLKKWLENHHAF